MKAVAAGEIGFRRSPAARARPPQAHHRLPRLFAIAGLITLAPAGRSLAAPPDPLLPLIHRVESFLRRQESAGVTMDPRFSQNPPEVARLTVVCQLLGYADLYLATGNRTDLDHVVTRADFLVENFDQVTSRSVFDGMLGYALLSAYEITGDRRYFDKGALIAARVVFDTGANIRLNWGMMAGMCLAKYHALTGDVAALQRTKALVSGLRPAQHADGSFPHYCPASTDVHYTGWLAMELMVVRRFLDDPTLDTTLGRIHDFLRVRIGPDGETRYSYCPDCSGDADGDGICDEDDACPDTPGGCGVDPVGCEFDGNRDGICDPLCRLGDQDLDRACNGTDRCPGTPRGCAVDRLGCELDRDGDGVCDAARSCTQYYSQGSGCKIDYDTRGWINELGYNAMVLDRFGDSAYHAVMGFLYERTSHGTVPDKWGYFPPASDPIAPWAIREASVMRTSVVFWSLAEIYWARSGRMSVRYGRPLPLKPLASLVDLGDLDGPAARGFGAADSLFLAGADPEGNPARAGGFGGGPRATLLEGGITGSPEGHASNDAPAASPTRPAGDRASVRYVLAADAEVSAAVFDLAGRQVFERNLGLLTRGSHEWVWDCRDRSGHRVAPGMYLVRVRSGAAPIATGRWIVPR